MNDFAPADVAASVGRALWGEVSPKLRSVQYRTVGKQIELKFSLDGVVDGDERRLDQLRGRGGRGRLPGCESARGSDLHGSGQRYRHPGRLAYRLREEGTLDGALIASRPSPPPIAPPGPNGPR